MNAVQQAKADRDAAQERYDYYREKANECDQAREDLERAIEALYQAINEAIAELEMYIEEVKRADATRAQELRNKLYDLKGFRDMLSDIRESFDEAGSLTLRILSIFQVRFVT